MIALPTNPVPPATNIILSLALITPLQAVIQGSLAHTTAASQVRKNSYALTPHDIIEAITTI